MKDRDAINLMLRNQYEILHALASLAHKADCESTVWLLKTAAHKTAAAISERNT